MRNALSRGQCALAAKRDLERGCEHVPLRAPYPSRAATALFAISVPAVIAGFVLILLGPPRIGEVIGLVGVFGAIGSSWVNHKRSGV